MAAKPEYAVKEKRKYFQKDSFLKCTETFLKIFFIFLKKVKSSFWQQNPTLLQMYYKLSMPNFQQFKISEKAVQV